MILVILEHDQNKIKKSSLEALSMGRQIAKNEGTTCTALVIGKIEGLEAMGNYGANSVEVISYDGGFDAQQYTIAIKVVASAIGAQTIILNHSANGKSLAGRLAVRMDADVVTAATAYISSDDGLTLTKALYAGKAVGTYQLKTENKIFTLAGNSVQPELIEGNECNVNISSVVIGTALVNVTNIDKVKGEIPLPEAELVVSAGRGMKGPENWGIIDELANTLGATTACSRPVADLDWRPHHEHVGQTGIAIRPNLYIAIGISGAIQHLAGVNNSKVIVVINKDPEAPFFKAADYGVCADLFDVVPKLTKELKNYKSA